MVEYSTRTVTGASGNSDSSRSASRTDCAPSCLLIKIALSMYDSGQMGWKCTDCAAGRVGEGGCAPFFIQHLPPIAWPDEPVLCGLARREGQMCTVCPARTQRNRRFGPDVVRCFRARQEPLQHLDEARSNGREKLAAESDHAQLADERRIDNGHRTYP